MTNNKILPVMNAKSPYTKVNVDLKTPLLVGSSVDKKRAELKAYFRQTWSTYESLFSLINANEAYYLRPEPLRHPLIFYFGHTATFFINKLILGKFISKRVNPKLEAICAVGVDEMSWDDLNSAHYEWPSVQEVKDYREEVAQLVEQIIESMTLSLPITQDSLAWIILMGCEHERIHLETSSVIMRMLPLEYLTANDAWQACTLVGEAPCNEYLGVQGQSLTLGKPKDDNTYGWDNEYGATDVIVDDFNASKYLISNQEYLSFVEAGGYLSDEYWTDEGKQWLAYKKPTMPKFWLKKNNPNTDGTVKYYQRNLHEEIPLPLNWPVEVNYLEAKAYCNWQSVKHSLNIRLPTEAEWHCLRGKLKCDLTNWPQAPGNINLEYFASSCPVNHYEVDGFYDVVGNVWQWTESAIDGYNGFNVHPLYDDFSTPTFDGRHNLIKGGSWISTGNEATKHSRYAFRRHFMQHAGFRTVESATVEIPLIEVNSFETDEAICQQLDSHYGEPVMSLPLYPKQLAQEVMTYVNLQGVAKSKVLDLGCGVGRCSFELAAYFERVDGVDFSAGLIQHPVKLQQKHRVRYTIEQSGDVLDYNEVDLKNLGLGESVDKVNFSQGDASNLKNIFNGYDAIVLQNSLERTYDPQQLLQTLATRLNKGGLLFIASDYNFSEQHTEKQKWLSGIKVNGENVVGIDGLHAILSPTFELVDDKELTRVVKKNQRNFAVSQCQLSVWRFSKIGQ